MPGPTLRHFCVHTLITPHMEPLRGTYLHSIHHPQRGHRAQGARQRRGFTHVWPAANTTAYTLHCAWYPGENHTAKLPLLKGSAQGARQRWTVLVFGPDKCFGRTSIPHRQGCGYIRVVLRSMLRIYCKDIALLLVEDHTYV